MDLNFEVKWRGDRLVLSLQDRTKESVAGGFTEFRKLDFNGL